MVDPVRMEAWIYGRTMRNHLVDQYRTEYGIGVPPAPALIVDELLTDFFGVTLRYDPLSLNIFAQTEWKEERPLVTVNVLTPEIPGVIDAAGVQNVAKFHEMIHVNRDLADLRNRSPISQSESGPPPNIICYREFDFAHSRSYLPWDDYFREFWAEEAGRAAAVSYAALSRSDGFRSFLSVYGPSSKRTNSTRWQLLHWAAEQIGVNRSALIKQLELDGLIAVQVVADCNVVYPTTKLMSLMGGS